jgi:hypothetical protein
MTKPFLAETEGLTEFFDSLRWEREAGPAEPTVKNLVVGEYTTTRSALWPDANMRLCALRAKTRFEDPTVEYMVRTQSGDQTDCAASLPLTKIRELFEGPRFKARSERTSVAELASAGGQAFWEQRKQEQDRYKRKMQRRSG